MTLHGLGVKIQRQLKIAKMWLLLRMRVVLLWKPGSEMGKVWAGRREYCCSIKMSPHTQCQSYANIPLFSYLHQTFTRGAILGRFIEGRAGFASSGRYAGGSSLSGYQIALIIYTWPTLWIFFTKHKNYCGNKVCKCALGAECTTLVHLALTER